MGLQYCLSPYNVHGLHKDERTMLNQIYLLHINSMLVEVSCVVVPIEASTRFSSGILLWNSVAHSIVLAPMSVLVLKCETPLGDRAESVEAVVWALLGSKLFRFNSSGVS